jgi:hypothetical protein
MEQEFKNDYYNNLTIDEMKGKYGIGNTTYFALLKKLNIKRRPSSKISRILGDSYNNIEKSKPLPKPKPNYIPKNIEPNNTDETDDVLVYSKQFVPRGTKLDIEKKAKIVSKPKPVAKEKEQIEEPKQDDNNKSALLNAINRSTKVREKILNKKSNN